MGELLAPSIFGPPEYEVKVVPLAVADPAPGAGDPNLDVAGAHVHVEEQVTLEQLQSKEMSRLQKIK